MNAALRPAIITLCLVALSACGNESATPAEASQPSAEAASAPAPSLPRTPAPEGARAFIVSPADGATVGSPVTVIFGAENIEVAKAGVNEAGTGHHHLLINAELPDFSQPIPANEQYVHFGGGQTETTLELAPGTYELRLLFGDYLHIPHEPPIYSEIVTVTVE